jgi:hypothetical protein
VDATVRKLGMKNRRRITERRTERRVYRSTILWINLK